jgi:hypothetical protein
MAEIDQFHVPEIDQFHVPVILIQENIHMQWNIWSHNKFTAHLMLGSQNERKPQTQWLLVTSSFMNNI